MSGNRETRQGENLSVHMGARRANREAERLTPRELETFDALLAENQRLRETVRLREESQIPMIPHGAQQKMERLEAENQRLREALEQAQDDLEAILPPRGHEELAQGVYFAHKRVEKALAGDAE